MFNWLSQHAPPKRIYLQWFGKDSPNSLLPNSHISKSDVTHTIEHAVYPHDVEYVRLDIVEDLRHNLLSESRWAHHYKQERDEALARIIELEKRIQDLYDEMAGEDL